MSKLKKAKSNEAARMRMVIASDLRRDGLFAELYIGDEQWGEIAFVEDTGKFTLTIFPPIGAEKYEFDLEELQAYLEMAKTRLRD